MRAASLCLPTALAMLCPVAPAASQIPGVRNPGMPAADRYPAAGAAGDPEPGRATGFPFESRERALIGHRTQSRRFVLMAGPWRFTMASRADALPIGFERADFDASGWEQVTVPEVRASEGYGRPRPDTPAPGATAAIPVEVYRRDVDLPGDWSDEDVFLHVGAAGPACRVWINGAPVGNADNSKLPGEFAITREVRPGRNSVVIQFSRWSPGSSIDAIESRRVGGLEREVFLMAAPKTRVRDFHVHAMPDARTGDGRLAVDVAVTPGLATTARITLLDGDRTIVSRAAQVAAGRSERHVTIAGRAAGVRPWTAETPVLYMLLVELYDAHGAIIQSTYSKIGFRTVDLVGGKLVVNGSPVALRGVDRHEYGAGSAAVVSFETMDRDVQGLKRNGFNALRTPYPDDPRLYDLADRYGLYIIDQANVAGAAYAASGNDTARIARVLGMVDRDKNRPSVVAWSLGSGQAGGRGAMKAGAAIQRRDPDRPIAAWRIGAGFTDFAAGSLPVAGPASH